MKDYKKIQCIESEYFSCPETTLPVIEREGEEPSEIISQELPLSTDKYSRSIIRKRRTLIFEKKK